MGDEERITRRISCDVGRWGAWRWAPSAPRAVPSWRPAAPRRPGPRPPPGPRPHDGAARHRRRPLVARRELRPVTVETTSTELSVTGSLPPELTGLYVRNGSNPLRGVSPHWFLGDGMVHGVRLDGGSASWYRNRWVRTGLYAHGGGLGATGAPGARRPSPTCRWWTTAAPPSRWARSASPTRSTRPICRPWPGGRVRRHQRQHDRHPKTDPATGDLHSFGYGSASRSSSTGCTTRPARCSPTSPWTCPGR